MGKIGWGELLIVLIIALLVVGPDKLPALARSLGKAVRGVKRYVNEAARELEDFDDLKEIKSDVDGIRKDLHSMGRNLEKSVTDDLDAVEKAADGAVKDIRETVEEPPAAPKPAKETAAGEEPAGEGEPAPEGGPAPEGAETGV